MSEGKWFVGIFSSHNDGKEKIGISEYYDETELDGEKVLAKNLTYDEADRECERLHQELEIPVFDNMVDSY